MTPCDNVVRGGFTSKHVDTRALVDLLDTGKVPGVQRSVEGVHCYEVPVEDFEVWRIEGRHTLQVPVADGAYRISVDGIAHRVSVGG
jgi:mannose-6-phosphate isomerase class I